MYEIRCIESSLGFFSVVDVEKSRNVYKMHATSALNSIKTLVVTMQKQNLVALDC